MAFSQKTKIAAAIYQDMETQNTHADHIIPRSRGGDDDVANCQLLSPVIRHGVGNLTHVPGLIKRIIKDELWRTRKVETGEVVELKSFRELITAKPYAGWDEDPNKIEAIIRDDPEALALWTEAMELKPGPKTDNSHNNIMRIKQGTSRSYTVSRLSKTRPDLFKQVVAGKLSANAAAIEAGWRKGKTPLDQLRHWWVKASDSEKQQFLELVK